MQKVKERRRRRSRKAFGRCEKIWDREEREEREGELTKELIAACE